MGADQQFCLRWNNFHTNITSAFESLRDDEDFVDITLASEGKQIKAHKMVLSACSPYFRSLLKGNPCQHPIVFLKDVTFANLTSILDFMYHGEVNVSHNELATFLKTAEALKVRGLAEDEKKKESEGYNEASSPPPPRDPPDPGSPRPGEEANSAPDTHTSDSPPPKRQRRRSGASIQSADDTNETVLSEARESSVKNEPQDFNEDEADMLIHSDNQDLIKHDTEENNSEERNFGLSESVTISRSQAAMQQLQESFGSFLPGMGQSPGFLPHGATDMPRPPPYSMEGVQGLPPGISALPGPSMSQGAASQDASQGGGGGATATAGAAAAATAALLQVKQELLDNDNSNIQDEAKHTTAAAAVTTSSGMTGYGTGGTHQQVTGTSVAPSIHDMLPDPEEIMVINNVSGGLPVGYNSAHGYHDSNSFSPHGGSSSGAYNTPPRGPYSPGMRFTPPPRHRPATGDEMQCGICGRVLCNKYVLKTHMRDMHGPRQSHQCPVCQRLYSSLNSLRAHMSITHKNTPNTHGLMNQMNPMPSMNPMGIHNSTNLFGSQNFSNMNNPQTFPNLSSPQSMNSPISTQNIHSPLDSQSPHTPQSIQSPQNAQNMQNIHSPQNMQNIQSPQNAQNIQSPQNLLNTQRPQTPQAQNIQSPQTHHHQSLHSPQNSQSNLQMPSSSTSQQN